MITRQELQAFAPRPRSRRRGAIWDRYADALCDSADLFSEFEINSAPRMQALMAQWSHEVGGFTLIWESLDYRSVGAVRRAWRKRASGHSDEWIKTHLLRDPKALGDWAYGGRMGNRKGTDDGYDYRGFGIQQITGATDHKWLLDGDYSIERSMRAALTEWTEADCNALADAGNHRGITRAINGGLNGWADRQRRLARAEEVWAVRPCGPDGVPSSDDASQEPKRTDADGGVTAPPVGDVQGSRKWALAKLIKRLAAWLMGLVGVAATNDAVTSPDAHAPTLTDRAADAMETISVWKSIIQSGMEAISGISNFVGSYSVWIIMVGGAAAFLAGYRIQGLVERAVKEGRYQPSGKAGG